MDVWPLPECRRVCISTEFGPGKRRSDARLRRALRSTTTRWWLALPVAISPIAVPHAAWANDPCSIVGSTATCTGDQSSGVAFHDGSGITTVNVQTLTVPIQPPSGTSGVVLDQFGASAAPLTGNSGATGSPLAVTTDNSTTIQITGTARGISVTSAGGTGAFSINNGGNGGDGGVISITSAAQISSPGDSSVGIFAFTAGGSGASGFFGSAGHAGNGGGISITNIGAITMSGSGGQGISATSQSGSGPIDSALATGGAIQITNNGAISTTSAATGNAHGIVAQSLGTGGGVLHVRGIVRRALHRLLPSREGAGERAALPRDGGGRIVLLGR